MGPFAINASTRTLYPEFIVVSIAFSSPGISWFPSVIYPDESDLGGSTNEMKIHQYKITKKNNV